jgi:flagellar basal body-associated protein FliL
VIVSNSKPKASAQPVNYSNDQDNDDDMMMKIIMMTLMMMMMIVMMTLTVMIIIDGGFHFNSDVYDHGDEVAKNKHTNRLKISTTNLFQNPQLSKMPFRVSHF